MSRLYLTGVAMLLAIGVSSGLAEAKGRRVVVLDFEGSRATGLRSTVVNLLHQRHQVIPHKRYRNAARRLKARTLRPGDLRRVASKIRARAVVRGAVVRHGKRYKLRVVVRRGADGKLIKRYHIPLVSLRARGARGRLRISQVNKRKLERKMARLIRRLPSPSRTAWRRTSRSKRSARVASRAERERRRRKAAERRYVQRLLTEKTDADGNVIDDEVPPGLR